MRIERIEASRWILAILLVLTVSIERQSAHARNPASLRRAKSRAAELPGNDLPAERLACLERAIVDLKQTFGPKYPRGDEFLSRLNWLKQELIGPANNRRLPVARFDDFQKLKRDALLANPLLDIDRVLVVKRKPRPPGYPFGQRESNAGGPMWYSKSPGIEIGMPSNHECNSSLDRLGYDNEIAAFSPRKPDSPLRTVYRPAHSGYVGEMNLHWDADRLLFSQSDEHNWKVFEIRCP
jgi:hypothetical protein